MPELKRSLGTRTSFIIIIFLNPLSSTQDAFGTLDQVYFLNAHVFSSHIQGLIGVPLFILSISLGQSHG